MKESEDLCLNIQADRLNHQQTCTTRKFNGSFLGRKKIPGGNLDLYKEIEEIVKGNYVGKDYFFSTFYTFLE